MERVPRRGDVRRLLVVIGSREVDASGGGGREGALVGHASERVGDGDGWEDVTAGAARGEQHAQRAGDDSSARSIAARFGYAGLAAARAWSAVAPGGTPPALRSIAPRRDARAKRRVPRCRRIVVFQDAPLEPPGRWALVANGASRLDRARVVVAARVVVVVVAAAALWIVISLPFRVSVWALVVDKVKFCASRLAQLANWRSRTDRLAKISQPN